MSDIENRDSIENQFAEQLAKKFALQMKNLLQILGSPPDITRLSEHFWTECGDDLMEVIPPQLQDMFLQQAKVLISENGIDVDWTLPNQSAADWAKTYSYDLVRGITGNQREALNRYVPEFYENGWTLGDLTDKLSFWFGPVRAEMIAVTEITRAAVEGERQEVDELKQHGISMKPLFNTSNDELVCEICGPLNQQEITNDGDYPPLHPRCRCWVNHEMSDK